MNELLLKELYGNNDPETVKQAQAELVQQVAIEAGIDINALSDEDLVKFAHYVLTDGEETPATETTETATATPESEKIAADKVAEAEQMGRLMARAYVDEQMKIASAIETGNWEGLEDVGEALMVREVATKVASAVNAIATDWAQVKEAQAKEGGEKTAELTKEAALQYVEALEPLEFAKLAEARAAEILAANGIHPETFEQIEPATVKLAEFPIPTDCQGWNAKLAMKAYNDKLNASAAVILKTLGFIE